MSTAKNLNERIPYKKSLQEYFNVTDLAPYKNISLKTLPFSERVRLFFPILDAENLADLLPYSRKSLEKVKGLDETTVNRMVEVIEEFFIEKYNEIYNAEKNIDRQLLNAAVDRKFYVKRVIIMLENFSAYVENKPAIEENILTKLAPLRAKFENKKLQPFIKAYKHNHFYIPKILESQQTFTELMNYIERYVHEIHLEFINDFLNWLDFDLKNLMDKILDGAFQNEREKFVVSERIAGKTLGDIAGITHFTREWARQVELRATKHFYKTLKALPQNIIFCLYAMTGGKKFITLDDAKEFFTEQQIILFRYFLTKIKSDKNFSYDEEIDTLMFYSKVTSQNIDLSNVEKIFPTPVIEPEDFDAFIEKLSAEKNYPSELLRAKLKKIFNYTGKVYYIGELNFTIECDYILRKYFPNGYKITNEKDYELYSRLRQEIFSPEYDVTSKNVDVKIAAMGVLCGRGKYIHADNVHVSQEILDAIEIFIQNSTRNVLPFKEIFKSLSDKLEGTQVTDQYFLQGIIRFHKMPYLLKKDYLVKIGGMNIDVEFENFVKEHGEVTTKEIKQEFISFGDHNIAFSLQRCPEVIRIGEGLYMHTSQLDLREKDFEDLKNFLRQACENKTVNSRVIFNLVKENFPEFLARNKISNHEKLFAVLRYMLEGELYFFRSYISTNEMTNANSKIVLLEHLQGKNFAYISDLFEVCEKCGIKCHTILYLESIFRPEFIRINETTFGRSESLGITDEIISAVNSALKVAIENNDGWLSARNFKGYANLPKLNVEWTDFLLESINALSDKAFRVIKKATYASRNSTAIFVNEKFAGDKFKDLLLKVLLAKNQRWKFKTQEEIFSWLHEQGFCNKKLPKVLFDEGYVDDAGNISLP